MSTARSRTDLGILHLFWVQSLQEGLNKQSTCSKNIYNKAEQSLLPCLISDVSRKEASSSSSSMMLAVNALCYSGEHLCIEIR